MESKPPKSQFYLFNRFFLKNGSQLGRLHEFCEKGFLPALERHCAGPKIFLQATMAGHMPQVAMLAGLSSWDAYGVLREKLGGDRDFASLSAKWEVDDEQPVEHYTTSLLRATAYSPEISNAEPPAKPRIFEFRSYHSPSHWKLYALHQRFAGPEIGIFHRLGIRPILYTDTEIGPGKPCLVYLTPFESLAEREEKWAAFAADPEWQELKKESAKDNGPLASIVSIEIFTAAPYSPVR